MSTHRRFELPVLAATAIIFIVAAASNAATPIAPGPRNVWDGVYTDAQAATGAVKYGQQCARCHGAELMGTPEIPSLRGQLIARWGGGPLDRLSNYINRAMPMQSPGALPPETNAAILAFILKTNGAHAGATPLSSDPAKLSRIVITGKPKALAD